MLIPASYNLVTMFIFILVACSLPYIGFCGITFEVVHRQPGWVVLVTFWMHSLSLAN
jgi:hypothetical protein